MKYAVILLLVMVYFQAEAKDSDIKLSQLITQLDNIDVEKDKLPVYTEIIKITWRTDPSLATEYGKQALDLHKSYYEPEQESVLIAYLTRVYLDRQDLHTAIELTSRGVVAAKQANYNKGLTLNLFNQALAYQLQDKLVLALNAYQNLAEEYQKAGLNDALGNVYNNIGNTQLKLGDLNSAFEYYQKALPLIKDHSNRANYANTLMNIGQVFSYLSDHQQAESNYLLALSEINARSYPLSYLEIHLRLAILYRNTKQYEKALHHFKLSEQVAIKHKYKGKLLRNYYEQMKLADLLGDKSAFSNLMILAESLVTPELNNELKHSFFYFKARYLVELEQWPEAEKNIDVVIQNKAFESRFYALQESLNLAFKIKSELGKTDAAKELLFESLSLYKQQFKDNKSALLAEYAQLYKTNQKDQEIQKLQEQSLEQENKILLEQKQTRVAFFSVIVLSLIFIAAILLIVQRSRNLAKQNKLSQQLMADKKQFFADISHELRTPLTVFKLKMQELEYNIAENPEAVYKLLYERIDSFNHLINDISILAQNDQGELELNFDTVKLFDFFELSERDLSILASKYKLTVKSKIRLDKEDKAYFDSARIRQVLGNLFSNACRYTNSPGVIEFRVSIKKNNLRIIVEDSAPGLSKTQVYKVFDRLYRADKSRSRKLGGSGLGLSICQNLVQGHKGTIVAEQSELGGVKMTINLPVALD